MTPHHGPARSPRVPAQRRAWDAVALALGLLGVMAAARAEPAAGPRDPMRPPQSRVVAARDEVLPVLSVIVVGTDRRVAVIDGRVVREGDLVGGYRVAAVLASGVRLRRAGVERKLSVARATLPFKKPSVAPATVDHGER